MIFLAGEIQEPGDWPGVDEKVIEAIAEKSGRGAEPVLNFVQGDALLFAFLLAGLIGGFIVGYYFRKIFREKK